jgi:three-Cys-motif partner protein
VERIPPGPDGLNCVADLAVVGPWAREKLATLAHYLDFYTKVLKNQPWRTVYVDAFAGGGRAVVRRDPPAATPIEPLFAEYAEADADQRELIDGSPRVALAVANPFDRYVFIDPDPDRAAELEAVKDEYGSSRKIDILRRSAADGIAWVCSRRIAKSTHRGVAFLDPFGAKLDWSSVQQLADTGLFEVVVNFGLSMAIQRMLPNNGGVPDAWARTLDAYFGTHDWFDEVYERPREGLFETPGLEKRPDYSQRLLALYRIRLKEAFGHVSTPRLIRNTKGTPLYYLLWAGPHRKGLEGANHILSMGERLTQPHIRLGGA